MHPLYNLPPELLSSIFETKPRIDAESAIAWSHVSRFWRSVALETHSLWTTVNVRHGSADAFALRSYPLPVIVTLYEATSTWEITVEGKRALSRIRSHASRIQELCVSADAEVIYEISQTLGSTPLASLNILNLTSTWDAFIVNFDSIASSPNLREVYLDSVSVDFDSCANLTHLVMDNVRSGFTTQSLVSLVRRSPQLKVFSCLDSYSDEDDLAEAVSLEPRLELAHVEKLHLRHLEGPLETTLWGRLYIPSSAPMFGHCVALPNLTHPHAHNGITLEIQNELASVSIRMDERFIVVSISIPAMIPSLILDTGKFLNPNLIRTLSLGGFGVNNHLFSDDFRQLLLDLPFLENLRSANSLIATMDLILALRSTDDPTLIAHYVCPRLKHIYLKSDLDDGEGSLQLLPFLAGCLELRAHAGANPLETLEFQFSIWPNSGIIDTVKLLVKELILIPIRYVFIFNF